MAVTAPCPLLLRAPLARAHLLLWCKVLPRRPLHAPWVCHTRVLLKSLSLVPLVWPVSKLCPLAKDPLIIRACPLSPPFHPLSLLHPCLPRPTFLTIHKTPSTRAWPLILAPVWPPLSVWAPAPPPLYSQAFRLALAPVLSQQWGFQEGMAPVAPCCLHSWACQGPLRLQSRRCHRCKRQPRPQPQLVFRHRPQFYPALRPRSAPTSSLGM